MKGGRRVIHPCVHKDTILQCVCVPQIHAHKKKVLLSPHSHNPRGLEVLSRIFSHTHNENAKKVSGEVWIEQNQQLLYSSRILPSWFFLPSCTITIPHIKHHITCMASLLLLFSLSSDGCLYLCPFLEDLVSVTPRKKGGR
jgi:hypothetical protein